MKQQALHVDGFTQHDFDTFTILGLEERMAAIKERIHPKFRSFGEILTDGLSVSLGAAMFLHIAKHARRTVNPPDDTWLAISANKRGYKQHPHFQLGLFDDHVFIWLAFIYEMPHKAMVAQKFLDNLDFLGQALPEDLVISTDHMRKKYALLCDADMKTTLERFRDVKKTEFLIGRQITAGQPILSDGAALLEKIQETYADLLPLYQLSRS